MSAEKYGKRRQVSFRISEIAQQRLRQNAELFNLPPSEYAKAVLYRDLGVFGEPLDKRRKSFQRKQRAEEKDDLETFSADEESELQA